VNAGRIIPEVRLGSGRLLEDLKAIFATAGAGSRGDLMATVFRDHSMPGP
jgi:hypothetical protein